MAGDDTTDTAALQHPPRGPALRDVTERDIPAREAAAPALAGGIRPARSRRAPTAGTPPGPDRPAASPGRQSRRRRTLVAILLVLLVALPLGSMVMVAREAIWEHIFGPPDLGAYDFARPTRTGKMNDALACPEGACPDARPTLATPVFPADAGTLYRTARDILAAQPTTRLVADDPQAGRLRAVVRTPLFRFPDTLSVEVRALGPDRAALYAYSRSQIGHADLGANAERIRRLVDALEARLAPPG